MGGRALFAILFGVVTATGNAWAQSAASLLDGRTFHGEILDDKGVVRSKDVLTFKEGKFYSTTCAQFGFSAMPYWTRVEGETVHFLVEAANPESGRMLFKGSIRGERVEWKGVWTKERWYWSIHREIGFRGTEKR
jgi:hypothetical protein